MYVVPENLVKFDWEAFASRALILFDSIDFKLSRYSSVNRPSHSFCPCSSSITVFPSGKKMFAHVRIINLWTTGRIELSVEGFCLFEYFTVCRNDTIIGQLKAFNVFFLLKCLFSKFRKCFLFFSPS